MKRLLFLLFLLFITLSGSMLFAQDRSTRPDRRGDLGNDSRAG